jgi:hypothetical protein
MGIVNYYKAMELDPNIGGVCGFMGLYYEGKPEITEWNTGVKCTCDSRLDQDNKLDIFNKHLL